MNTKQLLDRLNRTETTVDKTKRKQAHLDRLSQCIRDAVRREDWAAVVELAQIAESVKGGE